MCYVGEWGTRCDEEYGIVVKEREETIPEATGEDQGHGVGGEANSVGDSASQPPLGCSREVTYRSIIFVPMCPLL